MSNHIDAAIQKLNDKIMVLQLAKAELENVRDITPAAAEKKARKPRQKRGMPVPAAQDGQL